MVTFEQTLDMGQVEKKSIHTKVIVGAGAVLLVLNLLNPAALFSKKKSEQQVSETSQPAQVSQVSSAQNPHLSWFDKFFCRGRSASSFCSNAVLHPKANQIREHESNNPSPEDESISAYSFHEKTL